MPATDSFSTTPANGRFTLSDIEPVRLLNPSRAPRNAVAEFEIVAARDLQDPWAELELDVEFTDPDGEVKIVPAFWAGGRTWRVRYSSGMEGKHKFRSVVAGSDGHGLNDFVGELTVVGYEGTNPLLLHGAPRVSDDQTHLAYANGNPFFWLGDTWWSGMTMRFRWPETFQTLADDRAKKGFTVIQIVGGLVPEFDAFTSKMASEGGQPWLDGGVGRINPAFYAVPDIKIDYLVSKGLTPCIVGGWGHYADLMGPERIRLHWRYLVARYGAYPVVWCIAGEVDLPGGSYDSEAELNFEARIAAGPPRERVAIWEEASRYVGKIDPFRRIRTVHPTPIEGFSFASSEAFESRDSFELDMMQTGHTGRNCVPGTMTHLRSALEYGDKPVLNGECSYEGIFDSNWQDIQRFLFWSHLLSGTAGHTYGTMPISTFNSREDPHVPLSHVSMHYWEDAINWLGSTHVGIGKRILERYQWWTLRPAPDAISQHAGPKDWFLPFVAATNEGITIIYVPAMGMAPLPPDSERWFSEWSRYNDLRLRGLSSSQGYCATWVNPRTGEDAFSFEFTATDDDYRLPASGGRWPQPTGEDWVLVVKPS